MPRVIVTEGAAHGLERCRRFLAEKNPYASRRAGQIIAEHLSLLENNPDIGRPLDELPDIRELVIPVMSGFTVLSREQILFICLPLGIKKQRGIDQLPVSIGRTCIRSLMIVHFHSILSGGVTTDKHRGMETHDFDADSSSEITLSRKQSRLTGQKPPLKRPEIHSTLSRH